MELTEAIIQNKLHWFVVRKQHSLYVPNVYFYNYNESDFISVTKTNYVHEYEIKISKSDFKAETKKNRPIKANFFWFVVPDGLIAEKDIPKGTGLIYVCCDHRRNYYFCEVKVKAKRRHRTKITSEKKCELLRKIMLRYWDIRLK